MERNVGVRRIHPTIKCAILLRVKECDINFSLARRLM